MVFTIPATGAGMGCAGRDLKDIRALLRANRGTLDMVEVRGYFALFDREALLDELRREIG